MLKKFIEELASPNSSLTTTAPQSEISDPDNLTDLYNVIITVDEQNSITNQEIIRRNYSFREELENMFDRFKSVYRECKAQRMLIKEVTKQFPSDLSKNTIEKRIERAKDL
ncbi:8209_t:CDS:1 [Funneliformis geosporum]|uniref:8209_t:CDS:1 n=1 Tax=Funneliformis geosporum TaxID=1117311 RepID=A0A9W4WY32_9GLOM|nr:8209_t:CDS:1 [Funneliformis geosporum]